jgi:hypothetical protein
MPMMRTPRISRGSRSSGTPDAVGMHRLVMTMASSLSGSARSNMALADVLESCPVTSVSELKGT